MRHNAFMTRRSTLRSPDPSPDRLTEEERADIDAKLYAGQVPRTGLVRKLLRLCDQRRDLALEQQRRIEAALEILKTPGTWSNFARRAAHALNGLCPHGGREADKCFACRNSEP